MLLLLLIEEYYLSDAFPYSLHYSNKQLLITITFLLLLRRRSFTKASSPIDSSILRTNEV